MTTDLADLLPHPDGSAGRPDVWETVRAAEGLLTDRMGAQVELADPEDLGGSVRSMVLRVRVARNPFSLPRTLVVKHTTAAVPEDCGDPFAREAASCQLFTALHPDHRPGPALIASDAGRRLLVLEDLGRSATLAGTLMRGESTQAVRALLDWARALGRLHAATSGREADFAALLRRLGEHGTPDPVREQGRTAVTRLPDLLGTALGVATPAEMRADACRAAELLASRHYRAYSPADLGPDNAVVVGRTVRFIDFESGGFRTALLDAAQLRAPMPSSWSGYAIPRRLSQAMLSAWHAEVAALWPELGDRAASAGLVLDGQLLWTWLSTWRVLSAPDLRRYAPALVDRWEGLAEDAAATGRTALAEHAATVAAALRDRFDVSGVALPPYPALR
ncbi:MAG TPA: hypothetical protein VE709_14640 [Pseudonocardiaceae bacterium]|jgi:hypothetical protein|nr:hypothetical protein [Pseudonocardiaceae bacterium]